MIFHWFYPLINVFGPRIIKYLKPYYTVAEKVHLEEVDSLVQDAIHPYIFSRGSDINF